MKKYITPTGLIICFNSEIIYADFSNVKAEDWEKAEKELWGFKC